MSELPKSWCNVEIEHVLKPLDNGKVIQQGWSPQCEKEPAKIDEWGVLKTTAIQEGYFLPDENKKLPKSLDPRPAIEIKAGDILMTCAGPRNRCGVTSFVKETRPRLMMSGKMYRFRADQEKIDPSYLEAFLLSQDAKVAIDRMKTGINDSGLNLTHSRFLKLNIPLAPLNEQKRVVRKIEELFSELDSGIESLKTAREQLKVYRQAVLKHAFEGKLTAPWREKNPANCAENVLFKNAVIKISTNGKKIKQKDYLKLGSIPVIDQGAKYIGGYTDNISSKIEVPNPVIVFGDHTKIVKYVEFSFAPGADGVKVFMPKLNLNSKYLFYCTEYLAIKMLDKGYARHYQHLEKEIFRLPSSEEQNEVVKLLETQISAIDNIETTVNVELQKSEALRQSILKKAFSGQLVAQNPADEPASVLLERIRSEKATLQKSKSKIEKSPTPEKTSKKIILRKIKPKPRIKVLKNKQQQKQKRRVFG